MKEANLLFMIVSEKLIIEQRLRNLCVTREVRVTVTRVTGAVTPRVMVTDTMVTGAVALGVNINRGTSLDSSVGVVAERVRVAFGLRLPTLSKTTEHFSLANGMRLFAILPSSRNYKYNCSL